VVKWDRKNWTEESKLKKSKNKTTLIILTIISVFLCSCPGSYLIANGFKNLTENFQQVTDFGDISDSGLWSLLEAGVFICGGGFFVLIPLVLLIIALVPRKKKVSLTDLKPTGASEGDPIPPPN